MRDNPFMNNPDGGKTPPSTGGYYTQFNPPPSPPTPESVQSPAPAPQIEPATPATPAVTVPRSTPIALTPSGTAVAQTDSSLASVVDTIEAIIIALILALVFRAFVVEAFVIPTGSMAPTLLGAHFKVACPKCGLTFDRDVNLNEQRRGNRVFRVGGRDANGHEIRADLSDAQALPFDHQVHCPNCDYAITGDQLPEQLKPVTVKDSRSEGGGNEVSMYFPWAHNGDRILVLKYLYAVAEPNRWDVIVFKEPMSARDNYIKRLIGLPGETVQIIDGDIYVGAPSETGNHLAMPEQRFIARKPVHIQNALWQLVYDNDRYPVDEGKPRGKQDPWRNPWRATAGTWDVSGPIVSFDGNADLGRLEFLVDRHYTRHILGYNNDAPASQDTRSLCGDLRLTASWAPTDGSAASLAMVIGKPHNRFRVRVSDNQLKLEKFDPDAKTFTAVTPSLLKPSKVEKDRVYHLSMTNVDRTVQFFINGSLVLEYETRWSAAEAMADANIDRNVKADIRIEAVGACRLSHLKLERDLFYMQAADPQTRSGTAGETNPLLLNADEFFALGDNSARSHDGRTWSDVHVSLDDLGLRPGIVPRRFLLGKAFFVYWPAGNRPLPDSIGRTVPPLVNPPLVPDAGDMRFIK